MDLKPFGIGKSNFEQRANIKFCFRLGRSFSDTYDMLRQVYGDNCLSRTTTYEWYNRFKNGREDINDDGRSGRPRSSITEVHIERVRDFIKIHKNCTLRFAEMELGLSKDTIHRILTENLGMKKRNSLFVPHKLTDDQKLFRLQYAKDIIAGVQNDPNYLYSIVVGGETWCFQSDADSKQNDEEWRLPDEESPKKMRFESINVKTMLICFYDKKGIIHLEFLPSGTVITSEYYVNILQRLIETIRLIRPEYYNNSNWRLLHEHTPFYRSMHVTDFLTKNSILTLNHSLYSPDLSGCDYFLFPKLFLSMKSNNYQNEDAIQKSVISILNNMPKMDLKKSFDSLLERANRCIEADGDYFD